MHQIVLTGHTELSYVSEEIMVSQHWIDVVTHREQSATRRPQNPRRVVANRSFMMKAVLMGIMLAAGGVETASAATTDPAFRIFAMCVGGGVLGMIAGICCSKPKDVQAMAQEIAGNLALAIAFGPATTFWVSARLSTEPTVYWFIAVSAVLGISGLAIVKAARSEFVAYVIEKMGLKKKPDETGGGV